ncbi:MAG: serine hydrolase, partial [Comamonadaceae bacterium]
MPSLATRLPSALRRMVALPPLLLLLLTFATAEPAAAADWREALRQQVERIDKDSPGTVGVYVKRLDNGETLSYGADRFWYLGSTVKVPIAITVLQQVDAGKLKLNDRRVLQEGDRIEAGRLVWNRAGTPVPVDELLKRMLGESHNTAANMLIRTVGEERFNDVAQKAMGADRVHRL